MIDQQNIKGQHAVVTGGGRGIGAAISEALALEGLRLSIMSRSASSLADHRESILKLASEKGLPEPEIACFTCDVGDPAQIGVAFEGARAQFGKVNVLVNNAGFVQSAPFEKCSMSMWDSILDVNLRGVFLCIQQVLSDMKGQGSGRIINVASTAGITGYPYVAAYCAAKHGVMGLTRSLGLELAGSGITVNAICPGYTDTDLIQNAAGNISGKTGRSVEDIRTEFLKSIPQGRFVEPNEIASAVLWLCQPLQASMTGQNITIAGGEVVS